MYASVLYELQETDFLRLIIWIIMRRWQDVAIAPYREVILT